MIFSTWRVFSACHIYQKLQLVRSWKPSDNETPIISRNSMHFRMFILANYYDFQMPIIGVQGLSTLKCIARVYLIAWIRITPPLCSYYSAETNLALDATF